MSVNFYFIKQIKDNSVTENEKLWPIGLLLTPELILRPCIRVIKPDTSPWAVTQSWVPGLELDAAAPQFLPHSPTQTPRARMGSKEKESVCPTIHALTSTALPLPVFLNSPLILSLLPQQGCSPHMWSVKILQPSVSFSLEWKGLSPLISKSPLLSISGFSSSSKPWEWVYVFLPK